VKTLAEIAIEAGLVTKDSAVKAGRIAATRQEPLVSVLIRELGVDEVALIGALRKQTRVPLIDPADVQVDPEALRLVARDVCQRLRVLPLSVSHDGTTKVLRIAMADPTDTSAILELEQLAACEIEVTALPLSAIEELVDKGYRHFSTAVIKRSGNMIVRRTRTGPVEVTGGESEVSVTAQIPLISLIPSPDLEARFQGLCALLVKKGLISEAELAEALQSLPVRPK
jgi:Type II secretion system (T2SS), protein E, N-terminal domain